MIAHCNIILYFTLKCVFIFLPYYVIFFFRVSEAAEQSSDNSSFGPSSPVIKATDNSATVLGNQSENINELIKSIAKDSSFMNEKEEYSQEQAEAVKNRESTLSGNYFYLCVEE